MCKKILTAMLGIILINASAAWAQTSASGETKTQPSPSVGQSQRKAGEAQPGVEAKGKTDVAGPNEKVRPRLVGQGEPERDDLGKFRRESQSEEEAAILPYYNNFLRTYRLGPEDVISVTVFGLDRYSRAGIVIPPNGVISYPLIGGVFVVGKTVDEVAAEITKRLNEYIIDPKVTVSLERAMSARYAVLGDVAQPGVKVMTHRLTVYEALTEAGGVLRTGDKSKVTVLRRQPDGSMQMIPVNVAKIEKGKTADNFYLAPGDQVLVPGNKIKTLERVLTYVPIIGFARIFMGGW
jgi:polysaccharide export outer membrane protein